MGLIQMAKGALSSTLQDQIRDYYRAPSFDNNTLMAPAERVVDGQACNNGNAEIISDGSYFDVAAGQCLIVLADGKICEMVIAGENETDENGQDVTGQFQFKTDLAPSLFGTTSFKQRLLASLKDIGDRFATGGQRHHTFRAFYINLKPLAPIKVGVGEIDFTDAETGISIEVSAHGQVIPNIKDPATFYARCITDPSKKFTLQTNDFGVNIKTRLKSVIKMMFGCAANADLKFSQLQSQATRALMNYLETDASNESLAFWGMSISTSQSALEIDVKPEDKEMIKELQRARFRGSSADILRAEASTAMDHAASNANGAAMGMVGVGMMGNMNGMGGYIPNANNMGMPGGPGSYVPPMQQPGYRAPQNPAQQYAQQPQQAQPQQGGAFQQPYGQPAPAPAPVPAPQAAQGGATWTCSCGQVNTMAFCAACGNKKPEPQPAPAAQNGAETWTCECGTVNTMKFCGSCGKPKPEVKKKLRCDKCGYEPDPNSPLKFCPNCGDAFTEADLV